MKLKAYSREAVYRSKAVQDKDQLTDAAPGELSGTIRARAGARTLLWGSGTSTWNQPANPRKHERT